MTQSHHRTGADLDGLRRRRGRLIGREAETGEIETLLTAARSGRGGAVFVTGEPGVGRTRLAAEAIAAAAVAGMATAQGRAGTVGPLVPYRPLVEALLSLVRAGLLPDPEEPGRYEPVLAHLLTDTGGTGTGGVSYLVIAEAVLRLLAVAGRRRGCLLVLDDLHEADAGTVAIVEYLLDNIGQQPTALLLTAVCEPCAATELAARACQRGAAALLTLRPLGHADVHLLVATELGTTLADVSLELVDRVAAGSAGIPFVVHELVHGLTGRALDDDRVLPAPSAVTDSVRRRAESLGPRGVEFLGVAALFGQCFPPSVPQHATGCAPGESSAILRAAVAAHLIAPDGSRAQWYAFRYPLAAQALLDGLGPSERAGYAGRAARALAELHPGLPGAWCARAAELHGHAGDTGEAIALYCEAAERARGDGAVERAVELLVRAHRLVDPGTALESHASVLEQLLDAVARSARFDQVPRLTAGLEALCGAHDLPAPRQAGLHARLAEIAVLRGRPEEALRHLETARWLLGPCPADAHAALVDLAAAHVELSGSAPDRLRTAAESARRAADTARRADLPEVAGKALLVLGQLAWQRDEQTAVAHFTRVRALAHARRLPVLRVSAEAYLARAAARRDALPDRIEMAWKEALRMGALPLAHETGCVLALDMVQRCRFEAAGDRIREGLADATRSGLGRVLPVLRLAEAVLYAHQGRRAEMQEALERLAPLADAAPGVRPVSYGLARAFCSLLEEQHDDVDRELAQALAHDTEDPVTGGFGWHGIALLWDVLAGRADRRRYAVAAEAAAREGRWNRQFVGLAHAVLLGREGRPGEAAAAASAALEAGELYPTARHLCVRLVARSAYENGWGSPVDWLREAEEYFHGAGLRAVVHACRALLRGMGASVRQRRTGTEQVPPELRRRGITVREFEVARLLAERIGNKDIAGRLHISPRTVEKHVASLLQKTGHPDRVAFASASRDLVT